MNMFILNISTRRAVSDFIYFTWILLFYDSMAEKYDGFSFCWMYEMYESSFFEIRKYSIESDDVHINFLCCDLSKLLHGVWFLLCEYFEELQSFRCNLESGILEKVWKIRHKMGIIESIARAFYGMK